MIAVSVAMPVHRAGPHFDAAAASILNQSLRDLELMVVLNGADADTRAQAARLAARDARVRVIELPEANLAAALNCALGLARHELVARMDADDLSLPTRLEAQAERMRAEPSLVGLGCAYERIDQHGRALMTTSPPENPREARWRLLLENVFAHGSMMLRRSPVLDAGGYDERAHKAQDYELWLRLTARGAALAALPDVHYRYRQPTAREPWLSSPEQAQVAGAAMARAWSELPAGDVEAAADTLARAMSAGTSPQIAALDFEHQLTAAGPTREGLIGLLWAQRLGGHARQRAIEAGRAALVREAGRELRAIGAPGVWLWGAGAHTSWLLARPGLLGLPIAGVIDDLAPGKSVGGWFAQPPGAVRTGEHVLLSSDVYEDAMWRASAALRSRGVHVRRLYHDEQPAHSARHEEAA